MIPVRFTNDVANVKTHLLRVGRRSRLSSAKELAEAAVATIAAFLRCPSLSAQSVSPHHVGVLHQTSLRSRWTMMTRANSLHVREAGRPINVAVTRARGPAPTRASPHKHRAYDCRARPRRQNSA